MEVILDFVFLISVPRRWFDVESGEKIDQLGRMLKHLYPKGKSWASAEDRKLYWKTIVELQRTSKLLRGDK